jgi:hypothetical protein
VCNGLGLDLSRIKKKIIEAVEQEYCMLSQGSQESILDSKDHVNNSQLLKTWTWTCRLTGVGVISFLQ